MGTGVCFSSSVWQCGGGSCSSDMAPAGYWQGGKVRGRGNEAEGWGQEDVGLAARMWGDTFITLSR